MAYNTKIPLFRRWVLQNFPFIEQDFDALTDYQLICKVVEYLNQVIATVNETTGQVELLTNTVNQFVDYINHYFDNLDVQNEINNKLDEMYANGQLDLLFQKYINDYVEATNARLNAIEAEVQSLNDLTPTVVSSTSAMTDQDKIYLNTADGYWYYYNGTQFVQGGLYNSDATADTIKWYLNDVASDGNNLLNPFTSVVGGLKTSNGAYDPTVTTDWVTDFIPVDSSKIVLSNGVYRIGCTLKDNNPIDCKKVCFYDANKEFLTVQTSTRPWIQLPSAYEHISDITYIRIQFLKTTVPFEDRYKVGLIFANPPYNNTGGQLSYKSRYTSIDSLGIKAGGIENSRLSENLYQNNIYSMLQNEKVPFTLTDFGYGTIKTDNGVTVFEDAVRLNTCKIVTIPAGTSISLANDWKMLAFNYGANDTYLGRFYAEWGDSIYFPTDIRVRFVFKNDVIGNIASEEKILNLISNMSVSKSEGKFGYTGERITLKNKFGATNSGLKTYGQDSACYGNNFITFNSTGYYQMFTMNGDLLKASTGLDQVSTIAPHANSVCFGTERYDEGDTYPLLYVNAYNTALPTGACYVYRLLNNMSTSLQQTILIDFTSDPIWAGDGSSVRPYGNFIVDTDNNKLYAYVMIDSLNVTRFFTFNLPTLSQGSIVRLSTSDIEEYFDIEWMYYMQGVCYFNGKIYASCGFTSADCKLYAVDLTTKKVTSVVPLGGFVGEPETVFVYNDELYLSSGTSLFKLQF